MLPESTDFIGWIEWILRNNWHSILTGIGWTLLISLIATFFGCVIGMAVGIVQTLPCEKERGKIKFIILKICKIILGIYVEIFRGTPMMVQAAFIYYGAAIVLDWHMDLLFAAIFIVSINTGAYMAETVRGGILSIDQGQMEAAKAIGMTHYQAMRFVILPQAIRNIMPQIGNNLIINIKDTCVLSIIGVMELFYTMKSISGATYAFFPTFTIAMVVYFIINLVCSRLLRKWEKHLAGRANFELALNDALVQGEGMPYYQGITEETNLDYKYKLQAEEQEEMLHQVNKE